MTIGYIKGKGAMRVHHEFMGRHRQFTGFHFWTPGYCVSTIGLDEHQIREYVRNQEQLERGKYGQFNLPNFQ
jgi:putative transposase